MKRRKENNELVIKLINNLYLLKVHSIKDIHSISLETSINKTSISENSILLLDEIIEYVLKYINQINNDNNKEFMNRILEITTLISSIDSSLHNNFFIRKNVNDEIKILYESIKDAFSLITLKNSQTINEEINKLSMKLKELESKNKNNENLLESEKLKKVRLVKELEFKNKQLQEQLEKENELEKINRAIDRLQVPCDELQKSQDKFRENRDNFDKYAMDMFKIATWIFILMTMYLFFFTEINDVSKSVSIGYYLSHSFPILFPTIIGFLFIRQSNVNSKELDKINRRFILIHEVGQSLRALTEINDEKQMNEKTQRIIDKLIENILNYASENNGVMSNEESNILELNERLDKLIDTIDKKLAVVGKSG